MRLHEFRQNREKTGTGFDTESVAPITASAIFFRRRCSVKPCDNNIKRTIRLTREMIRLADQGDEDREDTGCGVLYGVLRDSAYKIMQMAEKEKGRHQAKGWWREYHPPSGRDE
jgi:hypothetical protein